jgi:hypothetical protein
VFPSTAGRSRGPGPWKRTGRSLEWPEERLPTASTPAIFTW